MTSDIPDAPLRRLLADLPPSAEAHHPVDVGVLGEYVAMMRSGGSTAAAEAYPAVASHLQPGCNQCAADVMAIQALTRRAAGGADARPSGRPAAMPAPDGADGADEARADLPSRPRPDPLEIADALALARLVEAERDALRRPLRPDPNAVAATESRRKTTRQRNLFLAEAALVRQRLAARHLFLARARAQVEGSPPPAPAGVGGPVGPSTPVSRQGTNPKAGLLLGHFAGQLGDLERLAARLGRLTVAVRRLGDDPRGPARPQSEALVVRGLALTRDALALDQRLVKLQGPLAGMTG